jgi:hypothetical protein
MHSRLTTSTTWEFENEPSKRRGEERRGEERRREGEREN